MTESPTPSKARVCAAILAGGKSSRFGSDKGLYPVGGVPIVRHVYESVRGVVDPVAVVCHSESQVRRYTRVLPSDVTFFEDLRVTPPATGHGSARDGAVVVRAPAVGMFTAFERLGGETPYVLVTSCDLPFVKAAVLRYLIGETGDNCAVIPEWENGFVEPLLAVYHATSTKRELERGFERGDYKIFDAVSRLPKVRYVSVERELRPLDPNLGSFRNVNEKRDLDNLEL
ncbi:MAG: molybdenum cofactor guanylyltransferase [Promethearchaeota archaeon]